MLNKAYRPIKRPRSLLASLRSILHQPGRLAILSLIVVILAALAATAANLGRRRASGDRSPSLSHVASRQSISVDAAYIVGAGLSPQLRRLLSVIGDRLERSGSERVVLAGSLSFGAQESRAFQLILEFPHKLRLETIDGVIAFDGQRTSTSKQSVTETEEKMLDSLLYDTADRFFLAQSQGAARRFLGSHFRLDDGSDPKYEGPWYDIYQVEDETALKMAGERGAKRYYFNSGTRLLERVRYDSAAGGGAVEVEIGAWRKVGDQFVPGFIRRIENGTPVFTLTATSAADSRTERRDECAITGAERHDDP